ncbi:hypothetical protein BAMA_05360 [Bacillus manliponensis]|uniref:Uncharacterized protein n=1 Tax=Bacillus manliponensis TaxID=574376 RepID=A0A073JW15_9BACI|nr:hypothetical protein [Bacillus manliponensis]KEK18450.1 hypothetical protein BAMA_05360 [Bacillus manliponensis]
MIGKYKGLIIATIAAIVYVVTELYLTDLEYMYRTGIKFLAMVAFVIGGIIVADVKSSSK